MRSSDSLHSPPPFPHPTPVPLCSPSTTLSCCPQLNLSVTLQPSHSHVKPCPQRKSQQIDQSVLKPCPQGQRGKMGNTQLAVTSDPYIRLNMLPQQPVRAQRKNSTQLHAPRHWVDCPTVAVSEDPDCLERLDLNTTLALKAELHLLQGMEFNSQKAINETLWMSDRTKKLINSRAADVVNVSPSQFLYTSLVSIDVLEDQFISKVLQERLLLVPALHFPGNKTADGPSHIHFMPSLLIRQNPLPPEEGTYNIKPHPSAHNIQSTFDLFRRQRCCNANALTRI